MTYRTDGEWTLWKQGRPKDFWEGRREPEMPPLPDNFHGQAPRKKTKNEEDGFPEDD